MKKRAVVFGTGLIYGLIRELLFERYSIVSLVDNNPLRWDDARDGVPITDPRSVVHVEYDVVVLASSDLVGMAKQLAALGVAREKMELGVNLVFERFLAHRREEIRYALTDAYELTCDFKQSGAEFILVDVYDRQKILLNARSMPTLIALYDSGDHLADFFRLSTQHHGGRSGIFLDIGANIGTTSLAAVARPAVTECIAFEPSADNYALLMSNVYLNKQHRRIRGLHCAVGERAETNRLLLSPVCSGDNRLRRAGDAGEFSQYAEAAGTLSETVETVAIDDFLRDRLDDVRFVWVDVQGYEYFVLKGCQELLKKRGLSVQLEYWPKGLRETHSLQLLNDFLVENFRQYVDMKEDEDAAGAPRDMRDIYSLAEKLLRNGPNSHTDIFLLQ